MNGWVWIIVVMVIGIIVGNVLLLKQSANMRMPKVKHDNNAAWDEEN